MALRFAALRRTAAVALALGSLSIGGAAMPADSPSTHSSKTAIHEQRLRTIFADDATREAELEPLNLLYRGELPDADVFAGLFTDTLERKRRESVLRALRDLQGVDRNALGTQMQLSRDVFAQRKQQELKWLRPDLRALTGVRPLNHFSGLHVEFPSLISTGGPLSYATVADYRGALALIRAFPRVIDNAILQFRQGQATGAVESKLTVRNMIGQIDGLLAQDVLASPFNSPVVELPDSIPTDQGTALRRDYRSAIRNEVYPAYRRLRNFLADEYLPSARRDPGLSAMNSGRSLYRALIERETTLPLDPEEVHRLGLSEVARIQADMVKVSRALGHTGGLGEFFVTIRTAPEFHPSSRAELEDGFEAIKRKVDAKLPRYFSRLPRTALRIAPYPAFREKHEPGASYYQGQPDGSRPASFYFNTYDLPSRYLSGVTTLYLHEALPGHHLQVSLAQEDVSLPSFQRFEGNNAYIEGWALYAETLGFEMGLYDDPMQHWGTLDDEMLRAMRLVVDTGIHTKGWSREQAIAYMLANSGMSRTDAIAEVERYIAIPAQALSYKIGALAIQRLRRKAEVRLGARFDIRAFHDQVLGSGALPLPILEAKIDGWIEEAAAARR